MYSFEKFKREDGAYEIPYKSGDREGKLHYDTAEDVIAVGQLNFCGCGSPEAALEHIYKRLRAYEDCREEKITYDERDKVFLSEGEMYFFLYWADNKGYMDHGTSVWSGWVTEKGKILMEDIRQCLEELKEKESKNG